MKHDRLFDLIKSLSRNEKGYFRKFCRIHSSGGDRNYIELFDYLDKLDVYDDKMVKTAFRNTKWISHLPALKSYLFHQILKSLEVYHSAGTKDEDNMLAQTRILIQRGLFEEAYKLLKKAQTAAEENENYYSMLGSLNRESALVKSLSSPRDLHGRLQQIRDRRHEVIEALRDLTYIQDLTDDLYELYIPKGDDREQNLIKHIDEMIDDDLLPRIENSRSVNFKRIAYSALITYYEIKQEPQQVFVYAHKQFELSVRHSDFFNKHLLRTYIYHFNYLLSCIASGHFKLFEENIKHFEESTVDHAYGKTEKFFMLYFLYFTYVHEVGQPSLVFNYLKKFEKDFKHYSPSLPAHKNMNLALQVAYLLFLNDDIERAIDWNNKALALEKEVGRADYKVTVRIQDLIFHYELGSFRLLDSKLLSAQRYLRRNSMFYRTEHSVISHLRQLIKAPNKKEQMVIFQKFKKNLNEILSDNNSEKPIVHAFDLIAWIDRRLQ